MENTIHSLENLFKLSCFTIPQYQRAYTWDESPHIEEFLTDLRQQALAQKENIRKTYFLGTFLLHEISKNHVHIVDGQQRLTTAVLFIAAALQRNKAKKIFIDGNVNAKALMNCFIFDAVEEVQKFCTIAEDNPFFRSHILGLTKAQITEASPSSSKMRKALKYFLSSIKDEEWENLVSALITAKVMVYSVENAADASLIFELQNDRGKKLTDLEALKSYLMHLMYLNAKNPEEGLSEIQTQFSNIYRQIEQHARNRRIPSEDAILSYHCAAYLSWVGDEWRRPKTLIKQTIKGIPQKEIQSWVLEFTATLQETFKTITKLFSSLDDYEELAQLVILDRMATFWPMVIKAFRLDSSEKKENFLLACRLMEIYAMRGFGLSNLRSDAGLSSIYVATRNFEGDFQELNVFLHSMSSWYELKSRSQSGLNRALLYKSNRRDTQYLLWRYENHLRQRKGQQAEPLSWKHYLFPKDEASKLSIEHIAAQNNPISETLVEWDSGFENRFQDVATHRLGNLVLDSISANSSKGKYDFTDKLSSLSENSTFLSQGELTKWAEKTEDGVYHWSVESIRKRHAHLVSFASQTWDPNTYFIVMPEGYIEEESLIDEESEIMPV